MDGRLRRGVPTGQAATPTAPADPEPPPGRLSSCGAPELVIMVLDAAEAGEALASGALPCPTCGRGLKPWGHARTRSVRGRHGPLRLRPRRARCAPCRTTHVLLPASCLPRRSAGSELVGAALLAAAGGTGHRVIAATLDLPADTVRGWLRHAATHAPWLRERATRWAIQCDPLLPPMAPQRSALADAVDALGTAAAAIIRRLGPLAPVWPLITMITGGRLLGPPVRAD